MNILHHLKNTLYATLVVVVACTLVFACNKNAVKNDATSEKTETAAQQQTVTALARGHRFVERYRVDDLPCRGISYRLQCMG